MERSAFFVQVTQEKQALLDILCHLEASGSADPFTLKTNNLFIRRERQTFRRLPKSDAVVFTVKTTITPLQDLNREELLASTREMVSWPAEVATYKGRNIWGDCAMKFCEQRLSEEDGEGLETYIV